MSLVTQVRCLPNPREDVLLPVDEPTRAFSLLLLYRIRPNLRTRQKTMIRLSKLPQHNWERPRITQDCPCNCKARYQQICEIFCLPLHRGSRWLAEVEHRQRKITERVLSQWVPSHKFCHTWGQLQGGNARIVYLTEFTSHFNLEYDQANSS